MGRQLCHFVTPPSREDRYSIDSAGPLKRLNQRLRQSLIRPPSSRRQHERQRRLARYAMWMPKALIVTHCLLWATYTRQLPLGLTDLHTPISQCGRYQ